jgi:cell wall-associated NlpC family hydrolase
VAINPRLWRLILEGARRYNLDPRAVAAIAYHESGGRFGAVGDSGSSFGPFQLHVGGALPAGRGAAWANSPAGVDYALRHMAQAGAAGLQGRAAIAAISRRFERPANPTAEIADAWAHYGGVGGGLGGAGFGQHIPQQRFIHSLRSALGTPYEWGGTSLQNGVDCSGLIWAAARQAGIKGVPRTSQQQFHVGHPVQMNGLRPGDLVFSQWGSEQGAGHVSIYIGNGKIIEAARPGTNVSIKPLSVLQGHILGARRILANPGQTVANVSGFAQQQEGFFNQQRQAAALSLLQSSSQPIKPAAPLVTPQQTIQKFIQAHQPKQPAAPTTPFLQPITPQPADYAAQLDTIHQKLLTA